MCVILLTILSHEINVPLNAPYKQFAPIQVNFKIKHNGQTSDRKSSLCQHCFQKQQYFMLQHVRSTRTSTEIKNNIAQINVEQQINLRQGSDLLFTF